MGEERKILEDKTYLPLLHFRIGYFLPVKENMSAVRCGQSAYQLQQLCLAGS